VLIFTVLKFQDTKISIIGNLESQ